MTSLSMRNNKLFMRNEFEVVGKWQLPLVKKQEVPTSHISLIACSDTKTHENEQNIHRGVHFFVDDYRFSGIYNHPERSLNKYSQYDFLLTPDFSAYSDMNLWRQLESVAKNRWVGAYWQSFGLTVIPTISWSDARSFSFCFDGVEKNSTVAVGMIGCKRSRIAFMRGYNEMLERLQPEKIIVFGTPFPEMGGNIVPVDYRSSRKAVR
jgi:hypothetical protein